MEDVVRMSDTVEVRRLDAAELPAQLDALASVLHDCVTGGASVSYMAPFSHEQARDAFASFAAEVEERRRLLLAAFVDGELVGTVQVILALPPNQPHRAEIAKLLVHRSARKRGIAQLLMEAAEDEARAEGKTLLVLDTVTGDAAERLYTRLGGRGSASSPATPSIPTGVPATRLFSGRRSRPQPNQRARRLDPKCSFSLARATEGSLKTPVGFGAVKKSTSTRPTRPPPNST